MMQEGPGLGLAAGPVGLDGVVSGAGLAALSAAPSPSLPTLPLPTLPLPTASLVGQSNCHPIAIAGPAVPNSAAANPP